MSNVGHMSTLAINDLRIKADGRLVVRGANFLLHGGSLHVLMGPNGSGKSSLLNAVMGHPKYSIVEGKMLLDGEDITALPTDEKARRGIFLSLQHLPEIAGVTLTNLLHKAHIAQKGETLSPLEFYKKAEARAKEFGIDPSFLKKHINSGLSGGEKKLSEVLQLLLLEPKFALLDEIDSGVDVDALKKVFAVVEYLKKRGVGFLIVSHHPNLLSHITPDAVSVMREGKIVTTGGKELAEGIMKEGFGNI